MGGWLFYRILLFSAKYQHESATGIHMSPPSWTSLPSPSPSHPSRLLQSPCLSSLSHTANPRWHPVVYTYGDVSLHGTLSTHLTLASPPRCCCVCRSHSSILAWEIPWTEEPGGLQSVGIQRIGHDWAQLMPCFTFSSPRFEMLHFFYKLDDYVNSALSTSISTIFPTIFAHFMFLCHILASLTIFHTFSLLLCLL